MDFKRATELFRDPEFDGDPVVIYEPGNDDDPVPPDPEDDEPEDDDVDDGNDAGTTKVRVSGVDAKIIGERIEYLGGDGQLITESYKDFARNQIRTEFSSLDDFIRRWSEADKKTAIIEELEEYGVVLENLAADVGKDFGDFDLLCHVAFGQPPLTRRERAENVKKRNHFTKYGDQARAVLSALLDKYADEGIKNIENAKILRLQPFDAFGSPVEIINGVFGGKTAYEQAIKDLEDQLYRQADG